MNELHLILI